MTRQTLRNAAQLCEHGLIAPEQRAALQVVAVRYAVALPPAVTALNTSVSDSSI